MSTRSTRLLAFAVLLSALAAVGTLSVRARHPSGGGAEPRPRTRVADLPVSTPPVQGTEAAKDAIQRAKDLSHAAEDRVAPATPDPASAGTTWIEGSVWGREDVR